MNRRTYITIAVSIVVVVGIAIGVIEFLSYKNVSLVFEKSNVPITIYNEKNSSVGSFSSDATTRLKEGSYTYIARSDNYSSEKVPFEVHGDQTVEISPSYSSTFLATLLSEEDPAIKEVLTTKYPGISEYIIGDERLAHHGEWYSAKLIQRVSGGNEPDVYRVILNKEDGTWKIVAAPTLVLSIADNPSIPDYVIRQANEPLSNEAYALLYPE